MKKSTLTQTILITSGVVLLLAGIQCYLNGWEEEAFRVIIRWTARTSALLFALAFGASGFQYFFKNKLSNWLLAYRAHVGLAFGTVHTFHLISLLWLQYALHPVFTLAKTSSLLGGGLAYLFMYLMMLTTFPRFKNTLSPRNWKLLHTIGGYWIWLIFFRSYFKNVFFRDQAYFLFALFSVVLIIRLARLFVEKGKR
ncbi:MAG: hypothetical protein R2792_05760 [Saprospiraceae bacterium]